MVMFKEAFTMANGIGNNELKKKNRRLRDELYI